MANAWWQKMMNRKRREIALAEARLTKLKVKYAAWQRSCDHKYANHRTAIKDGVCRICEREIDE